MRGTARPVRVALLGCGGVGREVLARIVARRELHAARCGLRFDVALVADRAGLWTERDGLPDAFLAAIIAAKAAGTPLAGLAERGSGGDARRSATFTAADPVGDDDGAHFLRLAYVDAVVDTTAADTASLLVQARRQGARLVLANKIPLAGSLASWDALTDAPGPPAFWGTTVASSLPVAAVVRALTDAGDPPRRMIGCLSGTIGVLLAGIAAGAQPSTVLKGAIAAGLAEPDPRRDLSGRDLAAKTLILARTAGLRLETHEVDCVPIVAIPQSGGPDLAAVYAAMDQVAGELRARMAASDGRLRYLAEVANGRGSVSLGAAPDDVASAAPTNSAIRIETAGFQEHPLFLSGRGGGAAATAEGVVVDLLAACRVV